MNGEPLLILDVTNIAHRGAARSTPQADPRTSIFATVFGDLVRFQRRYRTRRVAFCFDLGESRRRQLYPEYKADRRDRLRKPEDLYARAVVREVVGDLYREVLPALGFRNLFATDGLEADDHAAALCAALPRHDRAVVVSGDHDLYQCLSGKVVTCDPRTNEETTLQTFWRKWGVLPSDWWRVKAIAGGKDNLPGAAGVGPVSALKWLRGVTLPRRKLVALRLYLDTDQYRTNVRIARLPLEGTPAPVLRGEQVTRDDWSRIIKGLGVYTIDRLYPLCAV